MRAIKYLAPVRASFTIRSNETVGVVACKLYVSGTDLAITRQAERLAIGDKGAFENRNLLTKRCRHSQKCVELFERGAMRYR